MHELETYTSSLDMTKSLSSKFCPTERYLMSRTNYDAMSDAELKQYFLKHRGDQAAFQAYLDRINQRPRRIIASPDDPDFDQKVQAAIRQKLEAARSRNNQAKDSNAADD
jgi:hypothetical protein